MSSWNSMKNLDPAGSARRNGASLPRIAGLAFLAACWLSTIAAAHAQPTNTSRPLISGTLRVGSTLAVNPGAWTGARPITFSYTWRSCDASGANCTVAKGLFADGARPSYLLVASDAGRRIAVTVKATNPDGTASVTTSATAVVAAYPASAPPRVQFVNGLPDNPSRSSSSIFQFQLTGTGATARCQLDDAPSQPCPADSRIKYSGLKPGNHTVRVIARNANGESTVSHAWTVAPLDPPVPCQGCWRPALNTSWQWQLTLDEGRRDIDTSIVADMYDVDGFLTGAGMVQTLHSLPGTRLPNRKVVCYLEAGTLANFRPDAEQFPARLLGNAHGGFPDERWIDIRQISTLAPLLQARMDMCKQKGFDAIEFDNIDGWEPSNQTGLNLTPEDGLAFVVWLANQAHARGLSMAHKYNLSQIPQVLPYVDFAIVEQCFQYDECRTVDNGGKFGLDQFVNAGKAVFTVEYQPYSPTGNVCGRANGYNFNTLYKRDSLDSYRVACR